MILSRSPVGSSLVGDVPGRVESSLCLLTVRVGATGAPHGPAGVVGVVLAAFEVFAGPAGPVLVAGFDPVGIGGHESARALEDFGTGLLVKVGQVFYRFARPETSSRGLWSRGTGL